MDPKPEEEVQKLATIPDPILKHISNCKTTSISGLTFDPSAQSIISIQQGNLSEFNT